MRRTVRNAATVASAAMLVLFAVSCDDDDIAGLDDPDYTATLIAANEVNPPSTATGTGVATFEDRGTHFEYTLSVTGLTGVSASHIHGPAAAGANASVIINLFTPNGNTGAVNGVIATGIITDANNPNFTVAALRTMIDAGNAYVNVHTAQFPAGAIRGQIVPD
jgi:hypothetical protein